MEKYNLRNPFSTDPTMITVQISDSRFARVEALTKRAKRTVEKLLFPIEYIDSDHVNFSVSVFASLGGGHFDNLAGASFEHDETVLAQSTALHGKGRRGSGISGLEVSIFHVSHFARRFLNQTSDVPAKRKYSMLKVCRTFSLYRNIVEPVPKTKNTNLSKVLHKKNCEIEPMDRSNVRRRKTRRRARI